MGGYQNDGPLFGPLNTRCRIKSRTQKGTLILITTHIQTLSISILRFPLKEPFKGNLGFPRGS